MSQPDNKIHGMDGCRKFVEAIRSITGNPTMSKLDCEEWIERNKNTIALGLSAYAR